MSTVECIVLAAILVVVVEAVVHLSVKLFKRVRGTMPKPQERPKS